MTFKIGSGYDVHCLVEDPERILTLGGIVVPHDRVLKGHSDADVLVHAVCDALLGAAGLGDIGDHFPDSDPQYKGISSLSLLSRCNALLQASGYQVVNVDCTVFAEAPKLGPYKKKMAYKMAETIEISAESVNVKATTTEGLGFEGRGEGIAAHAVVLIRKMMTTKQGKGTS